MGRQLLDVPYVSMHSVYMLFPISHQVMLIRGLTLHLSKDFGYSRLPYYSPPSALLVPSKFSCLDSFRNPTSILMLPYE